MEVRFFIFVIKSFLFAFRPARADKSTDLFALCKNNSDNRPAIHASNKNLPFFLRCGMSAIIEPELERIVKRRDGGFEGNAMPGLILPILSMVPFETWVKYIHN